MRRPGGSVTTEPQQEAPMEKDDEIDSLVTKMLQEAARKEMTPAELERLERKVEIFQKAKGH